MGSILSFIVLCVANAAILSLSTDPAKVNFDRRLLINGDDGLFVGGEEEFNLWSSLSSHVGLTPSVGKVYFSNRFCVINSQLFCKNSLGVVTDVPYPNPSGMMQFDARTYSKPVTPLDLREAYKIWVNGFKKEEDKIKGESLWFKSFSKTLKTGWVKELSIPWHVPQAFGGLGIPIRIGEKEPKPLGRLAIARAKCCLKTGPLLTCRNEMWADKKGFYNPFRVTSNYYSVTSVLAPSDWELDAVRALGYTGTIEVQEREQYDSFYLLKREPLGQNLSAVTASILNGVPTAAVVPRKSDKIDFRRYYKFLEGKGEYQEFWWNLSTRITPDQLIGLSTKRSAGSIRPWNPKIPGNGLTDPYNDFLRSLQDSRMLVFSK